ncbi:MAG: hypothetical protein K2W95_28720 [Candidatus Obscuribacterales bacterium]|nr:hypothetical protein [Candidatus Obscuribacterales bacterium]
MSDIINGRINSLLVRIDTLTEQVAELKTEQELRVRNRGGRERLNGYRACQALVAVTHAVDTVRALLFTDPDVNYNGPAGEVATEQNEECLCMRFHDSAGNLGLSFDDVADAVLTAAEDHCTVAQNALNQAVLWAVAS